MKYIIYLYLLLFSVIVSYLYEHTKSICYKNIIAYTFLLFLVGFVSLRFDVGPDYYYYVLQFKYAVSKFYHPSPDYIFFNLLSDIFAFHTRGYIGIFSIYFLITFFLILTTLQKKNLLLYGIFIFFTFGFFFGSLDRIRQYLAMSIFIFAYDDILKNNFKSYLLKILFAFFFHLSAIILLPLYFLSKIKINKTIFLLWYLILMYGFFTQYWNYLVSIFYKNVPYYNEIYYDSKYLEAESFNSGMGLIGKTLIIMTILLYSNIENKYKTILFIGLNFMIIGAGNLNIVRISEYLLSIVIIAFPLFMQEKSNSIFKKILKLLIVASLMILYIKDIDREHYDFKTIFSKEFIFEKFESRN